MSNAKNIALQRIEALLDANSFIEIGGAITARSTDFNLGSVEAPSDGVITGYGLVEGKLVYVFSQNPEVLNGSIGEMHAKKITRLYNDAIKMGAPIIGCIDCSGIRLQEATDALNGFGEIYAAKAKASGTILQIDLVFGNCGGGMAIASSMSDFTFLSDKGNFFVNSPDAIDGNRSDKCDTSKADFLTSSSDAIDFSGSESEIISRARKLVDFLPGNNEDESISECSDDLNRSCNGIDLFKKDKLSVIRTLADNTDFIEVKENYSKSMITGFMKMNGFCVGVVANAYSSDEKDCINLCPGSAKKATGFVNFCDAFNIPVLTLAEIKGFCSCKDAEVKIAKACAGLTAAFAGCTSPKITCIIGDVFGSAAKIMNSKAIGADFVYAWPGLKAGAMDSLDAVKIIYAEEIEKAKDKAKFIKDKQEEYEESMCTVEGAARRGYIDTIIEPADTRKYIIAAFEMLYSKREFQPIKKHSTLA